MLKKSMIVILIMALLFYPYILNYIEKEKTVYNKKSELYEQTEKDIPELEGELTILSYTNSDMWKAIIDSFMEEHPKVRITVDKPSEQEEQTESFYQKYITRIMTGGGFDVVMTDIVNMEKYKGEQKMFVDLYEYIEKDIEFDKNDYFACIFEPAETEGKLFRMIRSVQPVYVRLNKALLKQAGVEYTKETVTFKDLYGIYKKVQENVGQEIYLMDYGSYDPLGRYENGYFIRNNLFDSDEYEEYLQMNHRLYYTEKSRPVWSEYGQGIASNVLCHMVAGLPLEEGGEVVNNLFRETEDMTKVIPYEGMHGERYFYATSSLAISNFSENKKLSWEFIKFVISNHDFGYEDDVFISPNKDKMKILCEGVEGESLSKLYQDIEMINTVRFWDYNLASNVHSVFEDYYIKNILTAEECCKELASRVYLYRNE